MWVFFVDFIFLFFDDTSLNNYAAFYKWQKILYIKKLYFFRIVSNENMTYTLIDSLSEIPLSKLSEKSSKSSIIYPLLFFIWQCICILLRITADDNFCRFQKQNQATLLISKCIKNLLLAFCHHGKLYWIYLHTVLSWFLDILLDTLCYKYEGNKETLRTNIETNKKRINFITKLLRKFYSYRCINNNPASVYYLSRPRMESKNV